MLDLRESIYEIFQEANRSLERTLSAEHFVRRRRLEYARSRKAHASGTLPKKKATLADREARATKKFKALARERPVLTPEEKLERKKARARRWYERLSPEERKTLHEEQQARKRERYRALTKEQKRAREKHQAEWRKRQFEKLKAERPPQVALPKLESPMSCIFCRCGCHTLNHTYNCRALAAARGQAA